MISLSLSLLFLGFSQKQKLDGEKDKGYEYLDHTADVQLHSWAPTLKEAMELVCVAMFGYITELDKVEEDDSMEVTVEASGHDLDSLLYSLMDEFLFQVFFFFFFSVLSFVLADDCFSFVQSIPFVSAWRL